MARTRQEIIFFAISHAMFQLKVLIKFFHSVLVAFYFNHNKYVAGILLQDLFNLIWLEDILVGVCMWGGWCNSEFPPMGGD